jgi:hypothetical protein
MKNYIFLSIFLILIGCSNDYRCSDVMSANNSYMGKGYLLFFRTSQDGMGDFWFFPCCNCDKLLKSKSGYEDFFSSRFGQGVAFKLPLTGTYYKEIKKASSHLFLDKLSFFSEVWLTPVNIKIGSDDKSALLNELKPDNPLKMNLNLNGKTLSLYYKNLVEFEIENLEVIK